MKKALLWLVGLTAVICSACSSNDPGEDIPQLDPEIKALVAKATVFTDATSSELMSVVTVDGDTITYFGDKMADGTANKINTLEYSSSDGRDCFLDFDEAGKLQSITSNEGATIEFEWLSPTSVVLKAHSQKDNIVIQTKYDFENTESYLTSQFESKASNSVRKGEFFLTLSSEPEYTSEHVSSMFNLGSRANYDPDQFPDKQEIHLWINQCGSNYNAKNYILLKNATTGDYIGKLVNSEHLWKGSYIYQLPLKSYPSSATNAELCEKLDEVLRNMEKRLGYVYIDNGEGLTYVLTALNTAAISTGIGSVPAVIIDAVVFAGAAVNCGIQIFNSTGGVSALMRQHNAEWYYKEYINSDLILIPVAYTQSKTVVGDGEQVNPSDESIFITLDMIGDPVIDNFTLNPSNPGAYEGYEAIAEYHCIPNGSTIKLSIVGTDGYSNSTTASVSDYGGSGSATLHVPGSYSGVYDLCTVEITLPTKEVLTMQASLVFGN